MLGKNKFQNTKNFTHFIRIWANIFLTNFSNIINNQNLTDAHTCYKMFKSDIFKKIKLREKRFFLSRSNNQSIKFKNKNF